MLLLSTLIAAALWSTDAIASYECINFTVPVTVATQSYQLVFPPFENHYQSVNFLNQITARNASSASPFSGYTNDTFTFSISAQYCYPYHQAESCDVQILTHGLGFDKSYWDFGGVDSEYNYIRVATAAGYSILSYDRLGNGASPVVDPYTVQQTQVELAILAALTEKLKNGTLDSTKIPKATGKVFHVGHSFGSILSHALAAESPQLSDGLILTGYSTNSSYNAEFAISTNFHLARENQPARFGNLSTGFLTWGDELANQYSFLAYPFFDPAVLSYAEAHKFPFSLGEFLSFGLVSYNASSFAKPVLIISGDADRIFCGADCYGILETAAPFFPEAKPFETYVQPHTGHGMNLHYNATGTYNVIQSFLKANA